MYPLIISIIGAVSAIAVSFVGALFANKNSILLQTRKLKEDHYISYLDALHHLAAHNDKPARDKYTLMRDKLFLIASENVLVKMLEYEQEAVGKASDLHDQFLTALIAEIRKDLNIKDKNLPQLNLRK